MSLLQPRVLEGGRTYYVVTLRLPTRLVVRLRALFRLILYSLITTYSNLLAVLTRYKVFRIAECRLLQPGCQLELSRRNARGQRSEPAEGHRYEPSGQRSMTSLHLAC